jgi:DNA-binding CsgD family transcriptional regulator
LVERQLKLTGAFTGIVFLIGGLFTFAIKLASHLGIRASVFNFSVLGCLVIACLFLVSAVWPKLFFIQPLVFFAITPIPIMQAPESFYGLGFFVFAVALLFRLGFFEKHRLIKLIACLAYLLGVEIGAMVIVRHALGDALSASFFILSFLLFFYFMFQDKLMVFLSEPKAKLSLEGKGLSETEIDYILSVISGKSVKETAFDAGVSESTVRNMLARGYAKLGVTNRAGLSALAEKYDVIR